MENKCRVDTPAVVGGHDSIGAVLSANGVSLSYFCPFYIRHFDKKQHSFCNQGYSKQKPSFSRKHSSSMNNKGPIE